MGLEGRGSLQAKVPAQILEFSFLRVVEVARQESQRRQLPRFQCQRRSRETLLEAELMSRRLRRSHRSRSGHFRFVQEAFS